MRTFHLYKQLTLLLICVASAFYMTGCSVEEAWTDSPDEDSEKVAVSLDISGLCLPVTTRAVENPDRAVETLDILIFSPEENGELKLTQMESLTSDFTLTDNKITFQLLLGTEDVGSTLVFIANAREGLDNVQIGNTKIQVLEKLIISYAGKWDITQMAIPMYAEATIKNENLKGGIKGIGLTRMLARIDVKVDPGVDNFVFESVFLCSRYTQGYLAPEWDSSGDVSTEKATAPNHSDQFQFSDDEALPDNYLEADDNIRYDIDTYENSCIGQIYTFESYGKSSNLDDLAATCLVVKGFVDNDLNTPYYYRIDFTDEAGDYMPLLRNHLYTTEITRVEGIGYTTLHDALNSYTVISNMHTRTMVWDSKKLRDIHYNGQYMLGVQYTEMTFGSDGGSLENFIATNYEQGITLVGKPDWVQVINIPDKAMSGTLYAATLPNSNTTPREGYIYLQAGRLTHAIKVRQAALSLRPLHEVNIVSTTRYGHLGEGNGRTDDAEAIRAVLDTHFKENGTVSLKQINYFKAPAYKDITASYLNDKDVLFLTYKAEPSAALVTLLIQWLQGAPHRVLLLAFDSDETNVEVFKHPYFKEDIQSFRFRNVHDGRDGTENPLVHTPGAEYFWQTGPFTNGTRINSASYMQEDSYFGIATLAANSKVLPIFEYSGGMVFGVNKEKRVVYIGDCQYGNRKSTSKYQGHRFNNSNGEVTNDVEKIFSNMWAWIIDEMVLNNK